MTNYRNMVQYRLIEELSEKVLDDYYQNKDLHIDAPIPIFEIGKRMYGLEYRSSPSKTILGALIEEDQVIYTNATVQAHPTWGEQRTRFTIAHEIAHYVLPDINDQEANVKILYKIGFRKDVTPEEKRVIVEQTADRLASAFLMPRQLVRLQIDKIKKIDEGVIEALANIFTVSQLAMAIRLKYLAENGELDDWKIDIPSLDAIISSIQEYHQLPSTIKITIDTENTDNKDLDCDVEPADTVIRRTIEDFLFGLGVATTPRANGNGASAAFSPAEVLKRPFIIEFSGTPNSGKDTQIKILNHYFCDRRKYRVHIIQDGYRFNELVTKKNTSLNKFFQSMFKLLAELMDLLDNWQKYDVVLINKGVFDNLAFLRFYTKLGKLEKTDEQLYTSLLLQKKWTEMIDLVFLLTISPEGSLDREQQEVVNAGALIAGMVNEKNQPKLDKTTLNFNNLKILNECYKSVKEEIGSNFIKIRPIHVLPEENKEEVAKKLAPELNAEAPEEQNAIIDREASKKTQPRKNILKEERELQLKLI